MKNMHWKSLPLLILLLAATPSSYIKWKTDPGATVAFTIQGLLGSTVRGTLEIGEARIDFDPADVAHASILVEIPIRSLKTGMGLRDSHLMKEEYFDPEKFPTVLYRSNSIERTPDGHFISKGTLTLKGREKPVVIPFTFEINGKKGHAKGTFTINRLDFGVGGKSMNMGDNVTIAIDLPLMAG
jgi:polyisoprenoid-binding protein YceI